MKHFARFAVLGAVLAGASAAAAQDILFFEQPDFNGRRFGANQSISNLADQGFNDRASSVVVRQGTWQLCSDAYFRGRCVTLQPGEYRNLSQIGLSNEVSSARELGIVGPGPGPGPGPGGPAAVTIYADYGFRGPAMDINGPVGNLGRTEFNDRARSMVVHAGTWEICRDDGFRGGCETFGPGRHANLGPLAGEGSSIRPIGGPGGPGGGGYPGDGWGSGARVILYQQPGFGGRRIAVTQDFMPNFASTGFNDRASSLRVERGYWMFCSDADFRGTCRTFGPGDYPNLPAGLNNQISSGRRISNEYPYNSSPNWGGYTQQ
jgi:hypothetical protein